MITKDLASLKREFEELYADRYHKRTVQENLKFNPTGHIWEWIEEVVIPWAKEEGKD